MENARLGVGHSFRTNGAAARCLQEEERKCVAAWERNAAIELWKMRTRVSLWERSVRNGASESIKNWLNAAQADFRDLDWHMRGWRPFAKQAVMLDGRVFGVLRPHLRADCALARIALEQLVLLGTRTYVRWGCVRPFIAELRIEKTTLASLLTIFDQHDVQVALTRPSALACKLLLQDPRALCYLGRTVQDSVGMVRIAVCAARAQGLAPALQSATTQIRASFSFGTWAMRADPRSFAFLSKKLRSLGSLLRLALEGGYGRALDFASSELQQDARFLRLALLHAESWQDLPQNIDPLLLLESAQEEPREVGEKLLRWLIRWCPEDAQMRLLALRIWPDLLPLASDGQGARFLRHAMLADPDVALKLPAREAVRLSCLGERIKACHADVLPRGVRRKLHESCGADERSRCVRRKLCGEMRCPVCLDLVRRPVMQCQQGHLICRGCLEELPPITQGRKRCPICRCEHEEAGFSRSLLADAVLDELPATALPEELSAS